MQKQLFFLISSYLIIYSFSADTDACTTYEDDTTCNEETINNCEWTETKISCAAATYTHLSSAATCVAFASCEWDASDSTCKSKKACSILTASTEPTCADSTYCTWTSAFSTCSTIDCTKLEASEAVCLGSIYLFQKIYKVFFLIGVLEIAQIH